MYKENENSYVEIRHELPPVLCEKSASGLLGHAATGHFTS